MKFTIDAKEFNKVLTKLNKLQPKKTSLSVLEGICFQNNDGNLNLYATDLARTAGYSTDIEVEGEGAFVLNGKILKDILKVNKGAVDITYPYNEDDKLTAVFTPTTKYVVKTMLATNYPLARYEENTKTIKLPTSVLQEVVKLVCPYASEDVQNRNLHAIKIDIAGGKLTAVATDGYRLAKHISNISNTSVVASFYMVAKDLVEFISFAEANFVILEVGAKYVTFNCLDLVYTSRLIDGDLPNFDSILNTEVEYGFSLHSSMKDIIDKYANKNFERMQVKYNNNTLSLSSSVPELMTLKDSVEVEGSKDKTYSFTVNARFINTLLKSMNGKFDFYFSPTMEGASYAKAIIVKGGINDTWAIMPIR